MQNSKALERKQSLLQMVDTLDQLWELAETAFDDSEHEAAIAAIERMLEEDFPAKADAVAAFCKHCESKIGLRKDMMQQIQADKDAWDRKLTRMREIARAVVSRLPDRKFRAELYNLAVHDGRRSVDIDHIDKGLLPLEYCRITQPALLPDISKIQEALERGIEVPGAALKDPPPVLHVRGNVRVKRNEEKLVPVRYV